MNTRSKIDWQRAMAERQERYNPIRNLTPEGLTSQIDSFHAGYLAPFSRTMEAVKRRDDIIQPVSAKREKAAARRPWEIVTNADLPEGFEDQAERHKDALKFFYDNLQSTSAVDLNETGNVSLLLRQMMYAVGFRYSVHHVVWKPTPDGLTAELIHCPLWFFENRTGRLRFLSQPHTFDGEEMREGEWLVSVNEGIMEACSVSYMFKRLPLKDWLIMSQDFGKPVVEGITDEAAGSEGWNALKDAVEALASDLRLVRSRSAEIKITDLSQQGQMPYEGLVERMDRRLAAIWRGGDLGTVSRADAVGANPQESEGDLIEEDDCLWLSETLNMNLDRLVIENVFGPGTTPLAYFKVVYPRQENIPQEIAIDTFLRDSGVPLGIDSTLERYGRSTPDEGEPTLNKPAAPAMPGDSFAAPDPFAANEETTEDLVRLAVADAVGAREQSLAPLTEEIDRLARLAKSGKLSDAEFTTFIERAAKTLPDLFNDLKPDALSASIEAALGTAVLEGVRDDVAAT